MKITRRTKLLIVALALCITTMVGSTLAWFTDEVTSANNVIEAGKLDIDLKLLENDGTWTSLEEKPETKVFDYNLWEPGYTQVETLKIVNNGNLALEYILNVKAGTDETKGPNGESLADAIEVYMSFGEFEPTADNGAATREAFHAAKANGVDNPVQGSRWWYAGKLTELMGRETGFTQGKMLPSDGLTENSTDGLLETGLMQGHCTCTIALHMDEDAGNEYQGLTLGTVGFTLMAKQMVEESDSFGKDYDKDATYPGEAIVTVPTTGTAVEVFVENVKVTIPANETEQGDVYKLNVSNENTVTDTTTDETTVAFDLTLYKNDTKVSSSKTIYEVEKYIGAGLFISKVTHNGTPLTKADTGEDQTYTYDSATGVLTIYTKSFSPFEVTYAEYKDYVMGKNFFYGDYISISTGSDFLPIVAVNPEITKYSVFDGDTRITDSVTFRFNEVAKQTIDENTYNVVVDLAILDDEGKNLELKPGMPSTINGREYLHVYLNLLEVPAGYAVSEVKVNGDSLDKTTNSNPAKGEYMLGYEAKDVYLQTMVAGSIEITVSKTN